MRILITGAGGPAAVAFIRAVEAPEIECFAGDVDPYGAGLYLVPPPNRWILHKASDERFIDDVLNRCIDADIDVVVPGIDPELLPFARRREDFEAHSVRLLLSDESALQLCVDKWELVSACAEVCAVPKTAIVDDSFARAEWTPPFIVKPRKGSGGRGVREIRELSAMADVPCDGTLIAQELLPGREYSVDVLCDRQSTPLAVVPRSRLKIDSGIAITGHTVRDERLVKGASAVAKRIGLSYVANIQFREDASGTPKLLDVNARFPGSMPLTIAAGVDMPNLALDVLRGRAIDPKALEYRETAITRTWENHVIPLEELRALEDAAATRDRRR
ncbi:MAG: ATP-grasp domain-containing protein [Gemmatimonadaceae bacterium]